MEAFRKQINRKLTNDSPDKVRLIPRQLNSLLTEKGVLEID